MTHIAICVWGICRSTNLTIESVNRHIFQPLIDAGITYDVFLHTYTYNRPYENIRAGEHNLQLNNNLWRLFNPTQSILEDQDSVDTHLNLQSYRTHGNPWANEDGNGFQTLDNHIHALWSLQQVTQLWIPTQHIYDAILYIRPDVRFFTSLQPAWIQDLSKSTISIPKFHLIDGVNDRFALGHPSVMKLYGMRFYQAKEYSSVAPLHSERFLSWILNKHAIHITYIPIKFRRIRADGTICEGDKNI